MRVMLVEVIAVPLASTLRRGARFTLRDNVPLVIGASSQARLQLSGIGAGRELELARASDDEISIEVDGVPIVSSVNGVALERDARLRLRVGDHLFVAPGLVLRVGPPETDPRHSGLEGAIADAPDSEGAWAVYRDFLLEHSASPGDVHNELAQRRGLGPLADSTRSGSMHVEWNDEHFLSHVHLRRNAIVGTPGLFWHLEQLALLRRARFLTHLDLDYFVGNAPTRVDRPFTTVDDTLTAVIETLRAAPFAASLRHLTFGHAATAPVLERTSQALERSPWRHVNPSLATLVKEGVRARVDLLSQSSEVAVVGLSVGESFTLAPLTEVGSSPSSRLRILGPTVPARLGVIRRSNEGAWSVSAEGVDGLSPRTVSPLRVNEAVVQRSDLRDGDVVELWPGVQFRFRAETRR